MGRKPFANTGHKDAAIFPYRAERTEGSQPRKRRRFRNWGLLDFCQNSLLIVDDRIESALILQYGRLVLLDRFLICLDRILVRENGLLIL
jgi:hypothetical protein